MPDLRLDPLSGRLVLVVPDRALRPHTAPTVPPPPPGVPDDCPFCPGHETMTPPEVARTGSGRPDTPGWRVRVVPNLYPIVGGPGAGPGATGAHEVAVLSPAHDRSFARLDDTRAVEVTAVLRERVRAHLREGRAYVQALINHGRPAGASLEHPHAQLVALDFVPPAVESELARVAAAGTDLVADALTNVAPVVNGPAVAWCPPASGTAWEMIVAHPSAGPRFDDADDSEVAAVALTLRDALERLAATVGDVPYNVLFHTAPPDRPDGTFHWYVEILPRATVIAGFEQGTGVLVNTVAPELATKLLRAAEVTA